MKRKNQFAAPSMAIALFGASVGPLSADIIAQYDMTTLNSPGGQVSTSPSITAAPGISAGDFTENLTGGTAQVEFGRQSNGLVPAGVNGAGARSLNSSPSNPWWEFTITPSPGVTATLTTITLDAGVATTLGNTTDWDYDVSTSLDGFATVIGTFDGPSSTTSASATDLVVDLSSLPAQSSAFTIRISPNRIAGTNGSIGQRAGWIDNVTLNAAVSGAPNDPFIVVDEVVSFTTNFAPITLEIPVTNGGANETLNITAATPGGTDGSNFSVEAGDLPIALAPSEGSTIPVTFTPSGTYQSSYTATLEITSNEALSPKIITLNISDNPDPWIDVADANLSNNGAADTYTVSVMNDGDARPLTIGTVTAGGFDAATISNIVPPSAILPGESGDITFTFTPDSGFNGEYNFTLIIPSDDPETPGKTISVIMLVADPIIFVNESTLSLGVLPYSPGPLTEVVTVFNDGGSEDLVIADTTSLTGDTAFTITNTTFPITIAPGSSADIEVTFTPGTAVGRFDAILQVDSNDYNDALPSVPITALVEPAGIIISRFDFDANSMDGTVVDIDGSAMTDWSTSDLTDMAVGTGALSDSNQGAFNRDIPTGVTGNYLRLSSAREIDAQTPLAAGGNDESTWTTFTITPDAGGGSIDFTGGSAIVDTYANMSGVGGTTSADWILYYSTDAGITWSQIGVSQAGASTSVNPSAAGPVALVWELSEIGVQTSPVQFILDPFSTGGSNGVTSQRGVGFDNLILTAGSITPGTGIGSDFGSWASGFGIPNDPTYDVGDNDGLSALVEYALGLSPLVSESLADTFNPATGLLSFNKGAEAVTNGDITYTIETSTDLGETDPWAAVDAGDLVEGTESDPATISYSLPAGLGKIFARLQVTQTPL